MARKLKKVSIDYKRCTGVGACEAVCPEVFFMREDGLPDVIEPEPHETLWDCCLRAEDACPEEAVILEWVDE
jgi:ferredoxin